MKENKTVVLTRVGTDFWSRPVYKVGDYDAYVKDVELGCYDEPSLYWSCPRNDPEGEPDTPFKVKEGVEVIIKEFEEKPLSREDKKFILAKMIAAKEYVKGKRSVEWVDLASGIKDIRLTEELLKELEEKPMDLTYIPEYGYVKTEELLWVNICRIETNVCLPEIYVTEEAAIKARKDAVIKFCKEENRELANPDDIDLNTTDSVWSEDGEYIEWYIFPVLPHKKDIEVNNDGYIKFIGGEKQ